MPIVVVDKDGKPLPASGLVFGNGYSVVDQGNGIVRIEVSGSLEVTKVVTAAKGVTRWLTTTRQVSGERVTDVTATQFLTKDREFTVSKTVGTLTHLKVQPQMRYITTTRDKTEQTHEKYGRTATVDVTVTAEQTHDKYQGTVTLAITATRQITVTKQIYVTRWV